MITVLIINNQGPPAEELALVGNALAAHFGPGVQIETLMRGLDSTSQEAIADDVMRKTPPPDILLVDWCMPDQDDGIKVINAVRKADYEGFTYLWSGAVPSPAVVRYSDILRPPGAGGYAKFQAKEMAEDAYESWLKLGNTFRLPDAARRVLPDLLDPAIEILSELQAGLLLSGRDRTDAPWLAARQAATRVFDGDFTRDFESLPNPDFARKRRVMVSLQSLPDSLVPHPYNQNDHLRRQEAVIDKLRALRDDLLAIAMSRSG